MAQAVGYAARFGSRFAGISNGHQWLLTLTYVTGQDLDQRTAYVFESLDAIKSRFTTFYRCFGPEGIYTNAVGDHLAEHRRIPAPPKLSAQIPVYPEPLDRNYLCNEIDYVLDHFWDTTRQYESDTSFLKDCYILPESATGATELLKELLNQRRASDEGQASVHDAAATTSLVKSYVTNKPILVLGRVGHGKSTFLRYLRHVDAEKELTKYVQIVIDFLDRPATAAEVESYVFQQIDKQLLETYGVDVRESAFVRAALDSELRRFRSTPRGSRYAPRTPEAADAELDFIESVQRQTFDYYTHAIRHLKRSHHASVAIFLDNLDRRVDEGLQEQAFFQASAMSRDWEALVFVCLRPGTYFRSVKRGVLDSVAPKIINIVPPRVSVLLRKRFEFASQLALGEGTNAGGSAPGKTFAMELPTTARFFDCCAESFYHRKETTRVFESACNGDMRALLRYVRDFITAKHLDTKKIVGKIDDGYLIPPHEALRALLYGDYWHYDPSRSVFMNLFDIEHADVREHFARPLSLSFLRRIPEGGATHGFCRSGDLTGYLLHLGFSKGYAKHTVEHLRNARCIEEREEDTLWVTGDDEEVRLTSLGRYHLTELVGTFQYVNAMIVDTPIVDDSVRSKLADARRIEERVSRARLFLDYLDESAGALEDRDAQG